MDKNKWNFINHPIRSNLDNHEVNYWRSQLNKLIKVGAELEFNLPDPKGVCKKSSFACGCKHMATEECWTQCANYGICKLTKRIPENCLNRTEACTKDKKDPCKNCFDFKSKCYSINCSNFVSYCVVCNNFKLPCDSCKYAYDANKDPENIRDFLKHKFMPTNCYGSINKSGVHSIKTDGSLLGGKGAEVITIGRRVDFWEFYNMFDAIIKESVGLGAYVNERCSVHMHILTSYYENTVESQHDPSVPKNINELEKPIPEIILINFHQLIRRYQNAITWMAMGLDDPQHMTRWEKYRVSVLDISPITSSMKLVGEQVYKKSNNMKYGFVDYRFCTYNQQGDARKFHVEIRALDGILSPSVLAAFACLYHALLIKAIEISRWGMLEMDGEWYENALKMKGYILNGTGDWGSSRFSDTKKVLSHKNYYTEESLDLIQQLKHILLQSGAAYDVLEKLAVEPVALKRIAGLSWEKIEEELKPKMVETVSDMERFVDETIDLRLVKKCNNKDEWISKVGDLAIQESVTKKAIEEILLEIHKIISDKYNEGRAIWSSSLGTVLSI